MSNVYIVQKGDCLSRIAQNNGVTLEKLLALNPNLKSNPHSIFPRQTIHLPEAASGGNAERRNVLSTGVHIVEKGESLYKIIKIYGITLDQILDTNPKLRENPNKIHPGQAIKIPGKKAKKDDTIQEIESPTAAWLALLKFDGKKLSVYALDTNKIIATYPARSGLPAGSPRIKELIEKHGRKDLSIKIDYSNPKHHKVKDAGPIPEDTYTLPLVKNMPYDKSMNQGDAAGWGEGGWWLREDFLAKLDNYFGGRSEFFLHHDGGTPGTGGCIGLKSAAHIKALRKSLSNAQQGGQKVIKVEVKY